MKRFVQSHALMTHEVDEYLNGYAEKNPGHRLVTVLVIPGSYQSHYFKAVWDLQTLER